MWVQVLQKLPQLQSLNLKGCPVCGQAGYRDSLLRMLPQLEILDGKRIKAPSGQPDNASGAAETASAHALKPAESQPCGSRTAANKPDSKIPTQHRKAQIGQASSATTGEPDFNSMPLADGREQVNKLKRKLKAGSDEAPGAEARPSEKRSRKTAAGSTEQQEAANGSSEHGRSFLEETLIQSIDLPPLPKHADAKVRCPLGSTS